MKIGMLSLLWALALLSPLSMSYVDLSDDAPAIIRLKQDPFLVTHIASLVDETRTGEMTVSRPLARHIVHVAERYRVDPLLIVAVIEVESSFNPRARSHKGARGLMQVMPVVMREVGSETAVSRVDDLYDPYKNVHIGVHYLDSLLTRYDQNLKKALIAYNMGPTKLDYQLTRGRQVSPRYYLKVMRHYQSLRSLYQMAAAGLNLFPPMKGSS